MTMNNSWGYNPSDRHYKSVRSLINTLSEVAAKGGRLLLNVSPRGDGSLAEEQTGRLDAIAAWMAESSESIVGTQPGLEPWQFYGPSTRRESRVYLHLLARPYDTISVRGVHLRKIREASVLASGERLRIHRRGVVTEIMFNQDPVGELIIDVPENAIAPPQTVIALDFYP